MDFTKSGRVDSFKFEKIAVNNLGRSLGWLKGVTGGSLTWDYYSDLKVSGQLNVVDTSPVENCLVRVWYCPELDGETKKIELCTCFCTTSKSRYEKGMWSGTLDLRSVLARFADDKFTKNFVFKKGDGAVSCFQKIFSWLGGSYKVAGVKNKKLAKSVVACFGSSPYDSLQYLAAVVNGQVGVDTHGRVTLSKYTTPSKRPVSYTIPSGSASVTLDGIDYEDTTAGTPNRAACMHKYKVDYFIKKKNGGYAYNGKTKKYYKKKNGGYAKAQREKTIFACATVAKSSRLSYANCGRYISETFEIRELKPATVKKLKTVADSKLRGITGTARRYTLECYYLPISIGQVVRFRHGSIKIDGLVTKIDLELDIGGKMQVELRKVR